MLGNFVDCGSLEYASIYLQYVIDRLLCARNEGDTVYKSLKCIGLYNVIVHMSMDSSNVTRAQIAEKIGVTLPGLIRPIEYLSRLGVIAYEEKRLPGRLGRVMTVVVSQNIIEKKRRDLKRRLSQTELNEYGFKLPNSWYDPVGYVLRHKTTDDTTAKTLKSLGLLPFISRLAAYGLPVTRPTLARRLSVAENTLIPLIEFLERQGLINVQETKIVGHIGNQYSLTVPQAVVERVRREMRRLENDCCSQGWPDARLYRQTERKTINSIAANYGYRFIEQKL